MLMACSCQHTFISNAKGNILCPSGALSIAFPYPSACLQAWSVCSCLLGSLQAQVAILSAHNCLALRQNIFVLSSDKSTLNYPDSLTGPNKLQRHMVCQTEVTSSNLSMVTSLTGSPALQC